MSPVFSCQFPVASRPLRMHRVKAVSSHSIPSSREARLHTNPSRAIRHIFPSSENQRASLCPMAWWKRSKPAENGFNPDMPLIRFDGISKVFRGEADEETWALHDVTVDIGRGEYVSI